MGLLGDEMPEMLEDHVGEAMAKHCRPSDCEKGKFYKVVASSYMEFGKPGDIVEIMTVSRGGCHGMLDDGSWWVFRDKWDAMDSSGNRHPGEILEGPYDSREGVLHSTTGVVHLSPGNECPDCGCAMEWVSLAMKCPKCWRIV
jgi:hypothetical protein